MPDEHSKRRGRSDHAPYPYHWLHEWQLVISTLVAHKIKDRSRLADIDSRSSSNLIERLSAWMVATRAIDDSVFVEGSAPNVNVNISAAKPHCTMCTRVRDDSGTHVDTRLSMVVELGVAGLAMHESLALRAEHHEMAGEKTIGLIVQHRRRTRRRRVSRNAVIFCNHGVHQRLRKVLLAQVGRRYDHRVCRGHVVKKEVLGVADALMHVCR